MNSMEVVSAANDRSQFLRFHQKSMAGNTAEVVAAVRRF